MAVLDVEASSEVCESDAFFSHTGVKLMVIELLLDSARCLADGKAEDKQYEKNWLLGFENDCAVPGPICFAELGGEQLDTHVAAIRFIESAEHRPTQLMDALRLARHRVRCGEFEVGSEDGVFHIAVTPDSATRPRLTS